MLDLKDLNFIYREHKKLKFIFIFYLVIFILIVSLSFFVKVPDKYVTNGIVRNDYIVLSENVINAKKISQSYQYKIFECLSNNPSFIYSDIYSNGDINIQEIRLKNKIKNKNNEIIEITFYYNKDLLIKKILKGVFG